MKKNLIVFATLAVVLFSAAPVLAQCYPGRIGGCPTDYVGILMRQNMGYTMGGGYGYGYGGGYYGSRGWKAAAINSSARVLEALIVTRAQTRQVEAMTRATQQPDVVYVNRSVPQEPANNNRQVNQQFEPQPQRLPVYRNGQSSSGLPEQPVEWSIENSTDMPILVTLNSKDLSWLPAGKSMLVDLPMNKPAKWAAFAYKPGQTRRDQVVMEKIPLDAKGEGLRIVFAMPPQDQN